MIILIHQYRHVISLEILREIDALSIYLHTNFKIINNIITLDYVIYNELHNFFNICSISTVQFSHLRIVKSSHIIFICPKVLFFNIVPIVVFHRYLSHGNRLGTTQTLRKPFLKNLGKSYFSILRHTQFFILLTNDRVNNSSQSSNSGTHRNLGHP